MQGQQKISASVQVRDSPIIVRILMRHEGERFHPHLAALVATSSFFLLAFFAPSFCIRMYKNIPTNPLPRLPPPFFIFLQNFLLFFFLPKCTCSPSVSLTWSYLLKESVALISPRCCFAMFLSPPASASLPFHDCTARIIYASSSVLEQWGMLC